MDEFKFRSLNELYTRIYPALNTKKIELKQKNIEVREIDIWNFLKENIWVKNTNLKLYDMVSDIFNLDEEKLVNYINSEGDEYKNR